MSHTEVGSAKSSIKSGKTTSNKGAFVTEPRNFRKKTVKQVESAKRVSEPQIVMSSNLPGVCYR